MCRIRGFFFFFLLVFHGGICEIPPPDLSLKIPMRDGVELPANVYLPHKDASQLPCILLRNPAGKETETALFFTSLAKHGYAVVIQDARAALDKEGKTIPYESDGWGNLQDGYDTIAWLAKSPLTNGKIGTLGASSMGITQLLLAPTDPPGLTCQYICVASSNLFDDAIFPGGELLKNQVEGWLSLYARHPHIYDTLRSQPIYNDFWAAFNTLPHSRKVTVPGLFWTGWFDTFLQGSINGFISRQLEGGEGARGKQKLVIGPWTHRWPFAPKLGDVDVPKEGREAPFDVSPAKWFDRYLKGVPNGIDNLPSVIYYVMGPFDGSPSSGNVWRTSQVWPVPSEEFPLYFTAAKELAEHYAPPTVSSLAYDYDPDKPIPTLGGRNLFLEAGTKDQRPIEGRSDVIVLTSAPLEEDIEVTGNLFAKIFFSTDQDDTDLIVRLTDVYPDGNSLLITEGLTRLASYCLKTKKNTLVANAVHDVLVDLWSTSIVFAKGHRIRLIISSSNYPRFEKNLNLGLHAPPSAVSKVAHNQIYCGGDKKSCVMLPLVRRGDKWLAKEKPPLAALHECHYPCGRQRVKA